MGNTPHNRKLIQRSNSYVPLLPTSKISEDSKEGSFGRVNNPMFRNNLGRQYKQLSSNELEEKRSKGLCYWCDEKYTPGLHCKLKQLFRLEVYAEENSEGKKLEEDKATAEVKLAEPETISPEISLNALAGIRSLADYNLLVKVMVEYT